MQAEEYGQKIKDAAGNAYEFANEKFTAAGDKFKEIKQGPERAHRGRKRIRPSEAGADDTDLGSGRTCSRARCFA